MRAGEVRALGRLAGLVLGGGARRVQEMHASIAGRVFGGVGPLGAPVRLAHDAIAGSTYAAVRTALGAGGRAAGLVAAARVRGGGSLADHPNGRAILAVLNGAFGDLLDRELAELALPMSLRLGGSDLAVEPAALAVAYPRATSRLVVFLHGLVETEDAWRYKAARHHGDPQVSYGTLLYRDLGYTPIWVRYNSGLHISDNGARLAALLDQLVLAWPVPVQDLVLVGHSMGGLVARSALHQAGDGTLAGQRRWPGLVRDTITLGSPHLGAPLEQGANVLTALLNLVGETRPFATVLAARSVGIKDLRYGNLVEVDWSGHDPDAVLTNTRTDLPLHAGARHFVVVATVAGRHDTLIGDLVGDLLVRPRSASGDTGDRRRMAFPNEHIHRLPGLHHLDLLNHPQVYRQIHSWLVTRPENDGSTSAFPRDEP
jgi:pimeloyl-ACP methyl ester carboxylesterase